MSFVLSIPSPSRVSVRYKLVLSPFASFVRYLKSFNCVISKSPSVLAFKSFVYPPATVSKISTAFFSFSPILTVNSYAPPDDLFASSNASTVFSDKKNVAVYLLSFCSLMSIVLVSPGAISIKASLSLSPGCS